MKPTIVKLVENKTLRWKGRIGIPGIFDVEHYFILDAQQDGTTLLTHGENFSGILIPVTGSVLKETEDNFHRFNERLKEHIENKR